MVQNTQDIEEFARTYLQRLSKDELLDLLKKNGNARKRAVHDACVFQTNDYNATRTLQNEVDRTSREMAQKKRDYAVRVQKLEETNAENERLYAEAQAAENDARKALDEVKKSGKNSDSQKAACKRAAGQISKENIQEINKILYRDSPADLIAGLEPLTAVLRNKMSANNADVEIFFKVPENLIAKINRMEMRDADGAVVSDKLPKLKAAKPSFERNPREGEVNLQSFVPLLEWGIAFCEGAQVELDFKDKEEALAKAEAVTKRTNAAWSRSKIQVQEVRENDFQRFFDDAIGSLNDTQRSLVDVVELDKRQAEKY
jgi:hypothetical protein